MTLLVLAATLRRKPPARATRLAIRGLVGSEVVCDAEKFNVNVCNVVPSYDKITLTGYATNGMSTGSPKVGAGLIVTYGFN